MTAPRKGCGPRRAVVAAAALGLVLPACDQVPKLPAALTSSDAAVAARPEPVARSEPVQPDIEAIKASRGNPPSVQDKIGVASKETDLQCARLVAPFSITDNLTILSQLGLNKSVETISVMFKQWMDKSSGSARAKNEIKTTRHNIAYEFRAAAYRMNWLPMEAEVMIGRRELDDLRNGGQIESRTTANGKRKYPLAQQLLDATLKGVTENHDYRFEVFVGTRSGQNASALPGGFIVIDSDLLEEANARKARFAMAHEVAHVLQRHQTRAIQARIIDTVSLGGTVADLAKVMRDAKENPASAAAVLALAGKLQFERFFARQELNADGCAVRLLDNILSNDAQLVDILKAFIAGLPPAEPDAKPDPGNPDDVVRTMRNASRSAEGIVDIVTRPIDRHPTTQERIANLNNALDKKRKTAQVQAAPGAGGRPPVRTRP